MDYRDQPCPGWRPIGFGHGFGHGFGGFGHGFGHGFIGFGHGWGLGGLGLGLGLGYLAGYPGYYGYDYDDYWY